MKRLGLFGGTFDPPHVGHLALAEWARERLQLERVLFVPAGTPPHKHGPRLSSPAARLAMTRLAVRGHPGFEVSTIELTEPGPSYTVETLRRLRAERPGRRWFLLIGADSMAELHTWRDAEEILELATLAVAGRAGDGGRAGGTHVSGSGAERARSAPSPSTSGAVRARTSATGRMPRIVWLDNPVLAVSSTLVRARVRAGRSIRYLVPDAVAAYIARHRLYRAGR